jgi:hypothetical protein
MHSSPPTLIHFLIPLIAPIDLNLKNRDAVYKLPVRGRTVRPFAGV